MSFRLSQKEVRHTIPGCIPALLLWARCSEVVAQPLWVVSDEAQGYTHPCLGCWGKGGRITAHFSSKSFMKNLLLWAILFSLSLPRVLSVLTIFSVNFAPEHLSHILVSHSCHIWTPARSEKKFAVNHLVTAALTCGPAGSLLPLSSLYSAKPLACRGVFHLWILCIKVMLPTCCIS